jgi:hypothetical protein
VTKREMAEDIVNILEELGLIKITDSPRNRPKPSAILPENHGDLSCISENVQKSEAP